MNLHDIVKRRDRSLVIESGEVTPAHGPNYMGARLAPESAFRLVNLSAMQSLKEGKGLGWSPAGGDVKIELEDDSVRVSSGRGGIVKAGERFQSRDCLIPFIKGDGVEVGPGSNPLARRSKHVRARYLEDVGKEEWLKRYHLEPSPEMDALWENYLVGNAHDLESVDDESLDFIVSCHVFEHLMNPLGVLRNWSRKLRPGGNVLNVVPDSRYCFDMRQAPSTPEEWISEFDGDVWTPGFAKYQKWCAGTTFNPGKEQSLIDRNYSIHVHYYTSETYGDLARLAVDRGYFTAFEIFQSPNHKDFAIRLVK